MDLSSQTTSQFTVGSKVVYPGQGVTEVAALETKDIAGSQVDIYVLVVIDTGMKILVPRTKAGQVGLRLCVAKADVQEVFDILGDGDVPLDKQTWNRRYRGFMEKIKTGSLFEVAEVFRDLYRLREKKTLSFGERRMLDTARDLIVKELAVACECELAVMTKQVEHHMGGRKAA